jgi:hypothetical protein
VHQKEARTRGPALSVRPAVRENRTRASVRRRRSVSQLHLKVNQETRPAVPGETVAMDLHEVQAAFEAAFDAHQDGREGLTVTPAVDDGTCHVSVRFQDVDAERGFDVVAEPLPAEHRSAAQLGQEVAEVVKRELAYGQLPARDEHGRFRRIVV